MMTQIAGGVAGAGTVALRGRTLTFERSPLGPGDRGSFRYCDDGLVEIADGRIVAIGPAAEIAPLLPPGTAVDHYPDGLILPGFIDLHIHLPQV